MTAPGQGLRASATAEGYRPRSLDALRPYLAQIEAHLLAQARIVFDAKAASGALRFVAGSPRHQQQNSACTNDYKCVRYTPMTSADLIREMQRAGWRLDRVNGSHHVYKHPERSGIVVVPHPKKDLGLGLVKAIRKQAGI